MKISELGRNDLTLCLVQLTKMDPYTNIPKGEMRLPGKGYETLNKLHPDIFGKHMCRIKIVRIAGNSLELQIPTMHSNVA